MSQQPEPSPEGDGISVSIRYADTGWQGVIINRVGVAIQHTFTKRAGG